MDFNRRILPYYMTYPLPYGSPKEETVLKDMEYLQQLYPGEVKKYQKRIAWILDKMDYEGSMIYDEYPDRCSLERLAVSILTVIEREEQKEIEPNDAESGEAENMPDPGLREWKRSLIQVLLYNEIYKRRHGGRRAGFLY